MLRLVVPCYYQQLLSATPASHVLAICPQHKRKHMFTQSVCIGLHKRQTAVTELAHFTSYWITRKAKDKELEAIYLF